MYNGGYGGGLLIGVHNGNFSVVFEGPAFFSGNKAMVRGTAGIMDTVYFMMYIGPTSDSRSMSWASQMRHVRDLSFGEQVNAFRRTAMQKQKEVRC